MREPYFQYYEQAQKRQAVSDADSLLGIYQTVWSDLIRVSKNLDNRSLLRDAEEQFYQRAREMATKAHKIKNKKGIQSLIYRHFQNGQTPSDSIKELAREVKIGNMSLLEGEKLNDYLHLFDSFS
ncbi:hypothetical protein HJ114_16970 [Vibrio parahaemolyticus]|nr:hypothetical protein [Vibrio parahaemolyticus]